MAEVIAERTDEQPDELTFPATLPVLPLKDTVVFPGFPTPVDISPAAFSADGDLAVLRIEDSLAMHQLRPLPLAENRPEPGELGHPYG